MCLCFYGVKVNIDGIKYLGGCLMELTKICFISLFSRKPPKNNLPLVFSYVLFFSDPIRKNAGSKSISMFLTCQKSKSAHKKSRIMNSYKNNVARIIILFTFYINVYFGWQRSFRTKGFPI